MSWEEGGLGEGTFPQRKASFVLDVVWVVAFDEVGGMIAEIDEAVYSGGMLRGPCVFSEVLPEVRGILLITEKTAWR